MSLDDLEARAKGRREIAKFLVIFYLCLGMLALLYSAAQ